MIALGRHPFMRPPIPNRGRIGISDYRILREVLWPKIQALLPENEVAECVKGHMGLIVGIRFKNGSYIDIMSYEVQPMKWESVDLDWVHFDEPPPYEIFKATRARLIDRDGRMWFTLTPLEEAWILDEIWEKCGKNPRYWGRMLDMRENPYLSAKAVADFVSEVTSDDYEARVQGQFRHLTGRVFKDYTDLYPYVMDREQINIDPSWPRLHVVDPHEKTPWACMWYAWDEEHDTVFRIDEIRFDPAKGLDEYGEMIRNVERYHNAPVPVFNRIIDNYAKRPLYNKGGSTLVDELREVAGLEYRECDKSDRNTRLWDLIYRYKINPATHIPRLVTLSHCVDARRETSRLVWDRHRTAIGQYVQEKQTPLPKDDHAFSCDCYMAAEWPSTSRFANPLRMFGLPDQRSMQYDAADTTPDWNSGRITVVQNAGRRARLRRAASAADWR